MLIASPTLYPLRLRATLWAGIPGMYRLVTTMSVCTTICINALHIDGAFASLRTKKLHFEYRALCYVMSDLTPLRKPVTVYDFLFTLHIK